MKINRKDTSKRKTFEDIPPATTFLLATRSAVFMKTNMSHFEFLCSNCDEENFVDNDFAINLETGEIEEFDYRTSVILIDCELNEI